MKIKILILSFLGVLQLSAQKDSSSLKLIPGLTYSHYKGRAFAGPSFDLNFQLFKKAPLNYRFGLSTGIFYNRLKNSEDLEFLMDHVKPLVWAERYPRSSYTGSLFLTPVELNFMLGKKAEYLEFGGDLYYLQFSGTREEILDNRIRNYDVQDVSFMAGFHLGVRHQSEDKGMFYRILWKPTWALSGSYENAISASVGYCF